MKYKAIILSLVAFACSRAPAPVTYSPGTTTAIWKEPTTSDFVRARELGIGYIEVAMNQCWRGIPADQVEGRVMRMKEMVDSAGVKVWSVHLPFSRQLDISVTDDSRRAANVDTMARMIRLAGIFNPERLVLHPSSEPITDEERALRLENSVASVRALKPVADSTGALLCIENLPRTCLGSDPAELLHIVESVPGVWICFDTNHYLKDRPEEYLRQVAPYVRTVHVSDYDFEDERHWLPGQGEIDWPQIASILRDTGYDGVFMYEVTRNSDGSRITSEELAANFPQFRDAPKN